ncbi:MAG TPA: hypothetical protein VJL81_05255 [Solirubrobacterales bacterium]|nr:hypothetical protein [Solirubrobacterales bacterium]
MKNLSSRSRRLVPLVVAAAALLVLVLEVGSGAASPAIGPAIVPQTPANGSPVAATEEPLTVVFSCPSYVYEEGEVIEPEEEGGEEEGEEGTPPTPVIGPPVLGGGEEYGVHFSTAPSVDTAGQLTTAGFGEAGEGSSEPIKGSAGLCSSELELPRTPNPATLYEGKVYWQAFRESAVSPDGVEVGPVSSFVVFPHIEEPELFFREQVFAGYLTKAEFDYGAELGGAVVQLQMFEGAAWKTIAEAPGSNLGENAFFFKVKKAGHHLFRALVLGVGGKPDIGLEPVVKVIRPPTKLRVTSAADDGAYVAASSKQREEWPITFTVKGGGTQLRNLQLEAETICKGPTKSQDVTIEIPAHLRNAKIAPDGTVFGVTATKGPEVWTVTLTGSLFAGRFQGELSIAHDNCTGYRTIDAILKRTVKT